MHKVNLLETTFRGIFFHADGSNDSRTLNRGTIKRGQLIAGHIIVRTINRVSLNRGHIIA